MQPEDIEIGKCYVGKKKNSRYVLVRKVLSLSDSGNVGYQFMSGPLLKKNIKSNSTKLKNFARWADKEIEELQDYEQLLGFVPQKNYVVLDTYGKELFKCQEKKVNFYLRKNLLKWIDKDTLQFIDDKIEKRLFDVHKGGLPKYAVAIKNQHCVVCGGTKHLTRHHIIPKVDLKYYDIDFKKWLNNNLAVCRKCHNDYELTKIGISFNEYNIESALKWMNHFIETMQPKYMPEGWHILSNSDMLNKANNG